MSRASREGRDHWAACFSPSPPPREGPGSALPLEPVSVQFSRSVVSNSLQPHGLPASLFITNSRSLLKLMSIESVMPSNHLILCRPLLLPPSIFPSISP